MTDFTCHINADDIAQIKLGRSGMGAVTIIERI